jgi:hypothetical protein
MSAGAALRTQRIAGIIVTWKMTWGKGKYYPRPRCPQPSIYWGGGLLSSESRRPMGTACSSPLKPGGTNGFFGEEHTVFRK